MDEKTTDDETPYPELDLMAVDFDRMARVQVRDTVLPGRLQPSHVTFPWTLADAIRFYVTKPSYEQEKLEILTEPKGEKRGRILNRELIYLLYQSPQFPRRE